MTQIFKKIKKFFLEKARLLWETFEEKLFRNFEKYKMNQEPAELLAKAFPASIIRDVITVGKKKSVENFADKNLWKAYNDITYQILHSKMKLTTRFDWSLKTKEIFEEFVREQEHKSLKSSLKSMYKMILRFFHFLFFLIFLV